MTQPQNPGQPYFPPASSAPSAPIPGQPYPPQGAPQTGPIPSAPSAAMPGGPVPPGQPYPPQGPAGDSLFGNLFDTSKGFAERFGKVAFIVAVIAFTLNWLYAAFSHGDNYDGYDFGEFLISLFIYAPWAVMQIFLVRLFIELVVNASKRAQS